MKTETIRLALEWIPNTNHTGFYAAIDNGYYEDEGLNLSIFMPDDHADGRDWLLQRKADFAITEQMSLSDVFVKDENAPLVAIAALNDHNLSELLTNHKITRPKDFTGNTYATFGYPTEQAIIRDTINADGGDFNQVTIVPNDMIFDPVKDLAEQKYDGIFVYHHWEGLMAHLSETNEEYHFFYVKDYVPAFDYYTPVLAANTHFLGEHGDLARKFLRATRKGFAFAEQFPEEAAQILMRYVPDRMLQEPLVIQSQLEISKHYRPTNSLWGAIDQARWEKFYAWLNQQKMGNMIPNNIGFTNKYLEL